MTLRVFIQTVTIKGLDSSYFQFSFLSQTADSGKGELWGLPEFVVSPQTVSNAFGLLILSREGESLWAKELP